jgi:drug/metabolite transporter (DMT)-like permease
VPWRSLPQLAVLGVVGAALIQWFYFVAIDRLPVGIAILLEFTGPVLVALWARVVLREQVRPVVWSALALSLVGLALVAQVWEDTRLDALGVAAAMAAAACLATFLLLGRRTGGAHDPVAVTFWMFAFASAFWVVVEPPWSIEREPLTRTTSLLGALDGVTLPVWAVVLVVIVLGTLAPYALDLAALRHLPAATVGAVGMLEPVVATVVAWAWLGQSLGAAQVVGGLVVLAGVGLAQGATGAGAPAQR